jgi:hypothetical protein
MKRVVLALLGCALAAAPATADFSQGFETDTSGWDVFGGVYNATRVASGTGGITSADGSWHATGSTAATNWGGYSSTFPTGGYITSLDIYLDMDAGWTNDTRFDWTSAISQPDGNHRRDFIFNGGFYNDESLGNRFVFSASNNAPGWPKNPGRDPFAVNTTDWYTFQHKFYDSGAGVLAVDLSILDSSSSVLHAWTLSDPTDIIGTTVGGNRYGWFVTNGFGTLAFDNAVAQVIPAPGAALLALLGLSAAGMKLRKRA